MRDSISLESPQVRKKRGTFLTARKRLSNAQRDELIDIDASESTPCGQQTRNTFYLSDVFVSLEHYDSELRRFLYIAFGCPTETPNLIEHSMYLAYAASLRSGDLLTSRRGAGRC